MIGSTRGAAAAALLMAMAGMGGMGGTQQPSRAQQVIEAQAGQQQNDQQRSKGPSTMAQAMLRQLIGNIPKGSRGHQRARGPGWTNMHAKRVARKARNVKAHRARSR